MNIEQLFNTLTWLKSYEVHQVPDFNPDEFLQLLGNRIVPTLTGCPYKTIQDESNDNAPESALLEPTKTTAFFDWHIDGLYYTSPPQHTLLYCKDPGHGDTTTDLASTQEVLDKLSPEVRKTLSSMQMNYIHNNNHKSIRPFLFGESFLLSTRGFLEPNVEPKYMPSLRSIGEALVVLYETLDRTITLSHQWQKGEVLVWDNHKYIHRRNGHKLDPNRKIIRMWFN
jgi:alpha-ketoglutarate-dependent taurine dioxygenase